MADILGLAQYVQQQGAMGKEAGQKSRLAKLYSSALAAPEDQRDSYLPQMAAESPDAANVAQGKFSDMRKQSHDDLGRDVALFVATAQSSDAATVQQSYARLAQKAAAMGHPVPPSYDPRMLPMLEKYASVVGGGSSSGIGVQSTFINDRGERVAIMRDGKVQVLGQNAPNNQIIDTGNGFYGVNKSSLQAAKVMTGGQEAPTMQGPPTQQVDMQMEPGAPVPPQDYAAMMAAAENPDTVMYPQANGGAHGVQMPQGQQLRSVPKPPSAIDQERLRLAQEASARDAQRLALQQQAAARAAAGKPTDQAKAEKLAAARADALDSVTQAISGIDSLMQGGGFDNLGTFTGDALSIIPHTKTKDASNALETVKNQVLLTTLGKLKALSATGASGFGALSNQEGKILQNSIANLETAQSHEAIVNNLKIIRGTLQRAAGLIGGNGKAVQAPSSGHVDDLLSKYGVK